MAGGKSAQINDGRVRMMLSQDAGGKTIQNGVNAADVFFT